MVKGTRSNRSIVPGPQDKCSPVAKSRRANETCLPDPVLRKMSATTRKRGGRRNTSVKNTRANVNSLARELGCKESDGRCMVENSGLSQQEKKRALDTYFRPKMPEAWKKDPDMWLTSDDIAAVMKQYEQAFPEFRFLGVVPIDFSAPDPYLQQNTGQKRCMNTQFCEVNLAEEKQNGRKLLGSVFNLDPHYKGGSHWVALAIDLMRDCVYYFDSYGMAPPPQVARYMRYLTTQNPKLSLQSNGRRFQYSDTECGVYSMYFLIHMIAGAEFKKFCKNPVSDKHMYAFRKILYDATAK